MREAFAGKGLLHGQNQTMQTASIVLIEDHDESGTHWYLSFDGPNPPSDRCVRCVDQQEALKLKALVEDSFRSMGPNPAGQTTGTRSCST